MHVTIARDGMLAERGLHEGFERTVQRQPEAPAVSDGKEELTYAAMNAWANNAFQNAMAQASVRDALASGAMVKAIESHR